MQILGLLGSYFHAVAAKVKKHLFLFKLTLAILWAVLFHLPFIIKNFITQTTFVNHFIFMDTDVDIINVNKISGILDIWEPFFLHEHQHYHYSPQHFHLSNDSSVNTLSLFLVILFAIFAAIFCVIFIIFYWFLLIFTGFYWVFFCRFLTDFYWDFQESFGAFRTPLDWGTHFLFFKLLFRENLFLAWTHEQ